MEYLLLDSTIDGRVHVVRREREGEPFSQPLATYRSRREARVGVRGQREVDAFDAKAPLGTPVEYWTGLRGKDGTGVVSTTRTAGTVMPDGHSVVWVVGHASCIALSHVRVLPSVAVGRT